MLADHVLIVWKWLVFEMDRKQEEQTSRLDMKHENIEASQPSVAGGE